MGVTKFVERINYILEGGLSGQVITFVLIFWLKIRKYGLQIMETVRQLLKSRHLFEILAGCYGKQIFNDIVKPVVIFSTG